ncbi:MAG TPA: 50S ribosomal protein L10 [Dehalococcoidia bacterium]|nr:50S ribosomal protein L10 [Dehalococcoidia bacterium]
MAREEKVRIVNELSEAISECSVAILTDYQGLTASEMDVLRRRLREQKIEYRVVKNTLARFAAEKADKEFLVGSLEGPVAIAFGYGDVTEPARALNGYIKDSDSPMSIKCGFMGDRLLTIDEISRLAKMPPREVLIAQVLAGMQAPVTGLVSCLAAPIRGFVGVLQSRIKQLEEK